MNLIYYLQLNKKIKAQYLWALNFEKKSYYAGEIASTGQTSAQVPQSVQVFASIT